MSDAVDRNDVILATLQAAQPGPVLSGSRDAAPHRPRPAARGQGVITEAELEQVVREVDAQVEVDLALSPPPLTDALEKLRRWRDEVGRRADEQPKEDRRK